MYDLGAYLFVTVLALLLLDGVRGMVNEHRARKREALERCIKQAAADIRAVIAAPDKYSVRHLIEDAHSVPPPLPEDIGWRSHDAWPL